MFLLSLAIALLPTHSQAASGPRCLKLKDHFAVSPIPLKGKLAVTYVNQTIDPDLGDNHELGVLDLTQPAQGVKRLSNNLTNESETEISPDGKKFLFTVRRKLDGFEENSEIWEMNMDGTGSRQLLGGKPLGVPAWNYPASDKFTFIQWGDDSGDSRLFTYDVPSGRETNLPLPMTGQADPEFSYDGKLITFKMAVEGDREFQPSIYVMNADGTNMRRLTRNWSDHDPVFSRDGRKIYFERYYGPGDWFEASQDRSVPEHNMWGIVEVDVKTKREKVIMPHDPCGKHFFWLPTVSPDGKSLMFTHVDVWGNMWTDLWVSDLNGKRPQKVRGSDWVYFFDWTE